MPSAPDQKNAISLMKGRLTWDDAVTLFPGPRNKAINGEGVRYTTADRLIRAEFRVKFTPNPGNPLHVSVENLDAKRNRTDDDAERFDSCFDDPEWKEA